MRLGSNCRAADSLKKVSQAATRGDVAVQQAPVGNMGVRRPQGCIRGDVDDATPAPGQRWGSCLQAAAHPRHQAIGPALCNSIVQGRRPCLTRQQDVHSLMSRRFVEGRFTCVLDL